MKSFKRLLENLNFNSDTALLIIDMINEFCSPNGWVDVNGMDYTYCKKCIESIKEAQNYAQGKNIPVFWVNWGIKDIESLPKNQFYLWKKYPDDKGLEDGHFMLGSDGVEIIPELTKMPNDILISKERISGFYETNLDSELKQRGIKTLLFAGVNTDQCVLETMVDANFLGYNCILLKDCCATNSPSFCEEAALYNAKECYGKVSTVGELK